MKPIGSIFESQDETTVCVESEVAYYIDKKAGVVCEITPARATMIVLSYADILSPDAYWNKIVRF